MLVREIEVLRQCLSRERLARPFAINAWVVLPEHTHWIWTLPEGDADYATRWRRIKTAFSLQQPKIEARSSVRQARGERGIWQRRYWEHQIRDDDDYRRHVDYIHYNPVKHGWTRRVVDWPHSSFHAYVERGVYAPDWADGGEIVVAGDD